MADELSDCVRRAAFRQLFTTGRSTTPAGLASQIGQPVEIVAAVVADMGHHPAR